MHSKNIISYLRGRHGEEPRSRAGLPGSNQSMATAKPQDCGQINSLLCLVFRIYKKRRLKVLYKVLVKSSKEPEVEKCFYFPCSTLPSTILGPKELEILTRGERYIYSLFLEHLLCAK